MILLDTHVVVWIAGDASKLSRRAAEAVRAARGRGGLAISDISLFELASLAARHRVQLHLPMVSFLEEVQSRFVVLPMDSEIAGQAVQLPAEYPNDPMDRIIGATAQVHGLSLVTADNGIRRSKTVKTIW